MTLRKATTHLTCAWRALTSARAARAAQVCTLVAALIALGQAQQVFDREALERQKARLEDELAAMRTQLSKNRRQIEISMVVQSLYQQTQTYHVGQVIIDRDSTAGEIALQLEQQWPDPLSLLESVLEDAKIVAPTVREEIFDEILLYARNKDIGLACDFAKTDVYASLTEWRDSYPLSAIDIDSIRNMAETEREWCLYAARGVIHSYTQEQRVGFYYPLPPDI